MDLRHHFAQSQIPKHSESYSRYANIHSQCEVSSPPSPLPPHLTTWQSFCGKRCQKGDHYQGRSPGFKSGQMPKRDWAEFPHKTPISNHRPSRNWRMNHSPAPSLCLLSSPFRQDLNPLSLCQSLPLFFLSAIGLITCTHATQLAKADVHRAETEG